MLPRLFNVLIWIVGGWIALLMINWPRMQPVLTWQGMLFLMVTPAVLLVVIRYVFGSRLDS